MLLIAPPTWAPITYGADVPPATCGTGVQYESHVPVRAALSRCRYAHALLPLVLAPAGLRATQRYIGVKMPRRPPSQRPSAPFCRKSLTLAVPLGARPTFSSAQAKYCDAVRPARVVCTISVRHTSGSMG